MVKKMPRFCFLCALTLLLSAILGLSPLSHASKSNAQALLEQWIRIESQISKEKSQWVQEKQELELLLSTLQKTRTSLSEKLDNITNESTHSDRIRDDLVEQKQKLNERLALYEQLAQQLSQTLAEIEPSLPTVLRHQLKSDYQSYIEQNGADLSLANRLAGLLRIIAVIEQFDHRTSLHSATLKLDETDNQYQADVLYLGLDHAFYQDKSGQRTGYGRRMENGWIWENQRDLKRSISRAIQAYRKPASNKLTDLSFPTSGFPSAQGKSQ